MKKYYTVILSIINVISSALLISIAFITKYFINYVTNPEETLNRNTVLIYAFLLLGIVLLQIGLRSIYSILRSRYILFLDVYYKEKLHNSLLRKDLQELNKYHSGEITNIYISDVRNLEEFLTTTIPNAFSSISRFLFSLVALIIIDVKFLLLLILLGGFASIIGFFYSKKMKKYAKKCLESDGKVNSFMQESLENIKIVKALEAEDNVSSELKERITENYKRKKKRNRLSIIGFTGIYGLMNFSYVLCLAYGGYAIAFLGLQFGDLSALLQLVSYLEGPLGDFSSYLNSYANFKASKERINTLLELEDETDDNQELDDFDSIIFENVTFYYEKDKPIIENFSLEIKKEDLTIFKGESGRGKTTLFMMILGFIKPIKGRGYIKYQDKEIPFSKATRRLFSYVPQDNIIFSGTIRENFNLLSSCSDEEKIYDALKQACLYDDVMKMPLKLDTSLKERGQGLSTGQIQRILIAISLLNSKQVLLLDEFTSSLDLKTEQEIVLSLAKLKKTIIMISHRKIDIKNYKEVNL